MENKQKIYRVDIIDYVQNEKYLIYSHNLETEDVFMRPATKADLEWHERKLKAEAQPDEQFVYGLF